MKRLAILVAAALALAGCVDRGECLATQTVHHDGYFYTTFIPSGSTMIPITNYMPPTTNNVCVRWEYPEGKPKK